MHGRRLYERLDLNAATPTDAAPVRAFLEHARELEGTLLASLRADPATAAYATPELLARNSALVWTWDLISLALLLDWAPFRLESVPSADGVVDVALEPVPPLRPTTGAVTASLHPWPFRAEAMRLHCEGRRLESGFDSDAALAEGLARAPWETLEFELVAR